MAVKSWRLWRVCSIYQYSRCYSVEIVLCSTKVLEGSALCARIGWRVCDVYWRSWKIVHSML